MSKSFVLSYGGVEIPFVADSKSGNMAMINATKMLECFPGKKMNNFLRNQATKDFINALSADTGKPVSELLVVKQGGNDLSATGTWMYEDLAIEFARWLNPDFAIWCNRKIKELLISGVVALEKENSQLRRTKQKMEHYANYAYKILANSRMTYSTTEVCKGFSCRVPVQDVLARLEREGYIGRSGNSNTWFMMAPHDQEGYTVVVSNPTVSQARWTEKGRWFLRQVLLGWGVIPEP